MLVDIGIGLIVTLINNINSYNDYCFCLQLQRMKLKHQKKKPNFGIRRCGMVGIECELGSRNHHRTIVTITLFIG